MKTAFGRGVREEFFVNLIIGERGAALGRFIFRAHAGPDVGIDRVRAARGFGRIVRDRKLRAGARGQLTRLRQSPPRSLRIFSGVARAKSMPRRAAFSISEFAILLPSPTNANFMPRAVPKCSRMVCISASAWQGWYISLRALITGTLRPAARGRPPSSAETCARRCRRPSGRDCAPYP